MKNLKFKIIVFISLNFSSVLIYSSPSQNISQLNSNLNSLAHYSNLTKLVKSATTQPYIPTGETIKRDEFFQEIVGMTENDFRVKYGWTIAPKPYDIHLPYGNGKLTILPHSEKWKETKFRAAIFQGTFKMYTLEELDNIAHDEEPSTITPYFRIIIHNPDVPEQTDIRYLQSDPTLANANFQVASTLFGPLEGGIFMSSGLITDMLHRPVQGEEASISAAPATIYRKYFMKPKYLLYNLKDKFNISYGSHGPRIEALSNETYKKTDKRNVSIGIHKNVVVSSGYGLGRDKADRQTKLPIIITDGKVDTNKTQIINQIFTAAYDLKSARGYNGTNILPSFIEDAARMILQGMYSATFRAPWVTRNRKIILTLLGAGAFLNELDWIAEALEMEINFIKKNGLQITLIYRPDSKPTRSINKDKAFLKKMFTMADKINNSKLAQDDTFNYDLETYLIASYNRDKSKKQAQAANQLNLKINNSLPSNAPKIKLRSSYAFIAPSQNSRKLEDIMHLKDGHILAWLSTKNDAVLVNIDPYNSTQIYVAPGYPGQSLPNGLFYWKSQGLNFSDIGNRKIKNLVRTTPNGKDFVYDKTGYVDSHHKNKKWIQVGMKKTHFDNPENIIKSQLKHA